MKVTECDLGIKGVRSVEADADDAELASVAVELLSVMVLVVFQRSAG